MVISQALAASTALDYAGSLRNTSMHCVHTVLPDNTCRMKMIASTWQQLQLAQVCSQLASEFCRKMASSVRRGVTTSITATLPICHKLSLGGAKHHSFIPAQASRLPQCSGHSMPR